MENDLSTSQDVVGANLNKAISTDENSVIGIVSFDFMPPITLDNSPNGLNIKITV